ncbi:MAG: monooxygenase component MmoB/DmpM [Chloroflexi bacterium]|jgi:phenol hydroxylase P2 protein|nr:monooxygenase component MmoB/DmpM [Chloroflexota bacterium]
MSASTVEGHIAKERFIGVDLQDHEEARGIVKAIVRDNPEAKVSQIPGVIKVTCHHQLQINRATVEQELRHEWDTQEFNMSIISYIGDIQEWDDDHILVKWSTD